MKIGILGAGHAGITLIAMIINESLAAPKLYSHPRHSSKIHQVLAERKVNLRDYRKPKNLAVCVKRGMITDNISDVVEHSDVIFNTLPINAHDEVFDEVLAATRVYQKPLTYFNLGGGFSIFSHQRLLTAVDRITLGTAHTLPFASRVDGTSASLVNVRKNTPIAFSGGGADCAALLAAMFQSDFPVDASLLHASIDRSSYVMHPLVTMLNVTKIDDGGGFNFYRDGFTESVKRLLLAAAYERAELANRLGYQDFPTPTARLDNFFRSYSKDFSEIRGPSSIDHRFITEDIPYGLVPICGLGRSLGLSMPICRSIVNMASVILGQDMWNSRYNLEQNPALLRQFMQCA